jgi:YHS domain-containing protein
MISALVREFVLPILVLLLLRMLLQGLRAGLRRPSPPSEAASLPEAQVLKKDPVCGTYVPAASSITRVIRGEVVHFCSEECSRNYTPR